MNKIILNDDLLKRAVSIYQDNYFKKTTFNEENYKTSESFEKRIEKIIKSENNLYYRITLTKARKAVCVLIAILILLLSSLSVSAVREAIANFFIQTFSDHNTITADTTNDKDYPTKIEKVYMLEHIPDDYELIDECIDDRSTSFIYMKNDETMIFEQSLKDTFIVNRDNEFSNYTEEVFNDQKYYIQDCGDGSYNFTWDNGEYVFSLFAYFPKETMFDLCDSVVISDE